MTARHWVIGAGGLLGSAVVRELAARGVDAFTWPVRWQTPSAVADLTAGLHDFVDASGDDEWTVYWCAGAATTSSDEAAFEREDAVFRGFVDDLATLPSSKPGVFFLASSAGAVYGGASGAPFTEDSAVAPLGRYGEAKLRQEQLVTALAARSGIRVAIGRIANLYGPGQSLAKQQGLVSRLCLATLTRVPLSVFVSIDTIRDYIYVDDCAELVVETAAVAAVSAHSGAATVTKILASGRSTTIGSLIAVLGQIAGRHPLVVWGQSLESGLQSSDLRLESTVLPGVVVRQATNLTEGVARTFEDLRRSVAAPH